MRGCTGYRGAFHSNDVEEGRGPAMGRSQQGVEEGRSTTSSYSSTEGRAALAGDWNKKKEELGQES